MSTIIHIITTLERGGAEKHLLDLSAAQTRSHKQVKVIPLKGLNTLEHEFIKNGIEVLNFLLNRPFVVQIFLLYKYKRSSFVILHAHLPRAEILAAICRRKNILIVTRHNAENFLPNFIRLSSLLSRLVVKRAKRVIAISIAVKNFLIRNEEISNKSLIDVVYYGKDLSRTINIYTRKEVQTFKEEINLRKEVILIGTISRLEEQKDLPTLLKAFKSIHVSHPNTHLLLAGDGKLLEKLKTLANILEISSSVHFIGKIQEIDLFLQSIDCFVLSSKYEGFGLVLLEAMQNNVPIVATNISAIPEVMGNEYPFLANVGNFNSFASKIENILFAESNFNFKKYYDKRLNYFSLSKEVEILDKIYNQNSNA